MNLDKIKLWLWSKYKLWITLIIIFVFLFIIWFIGGAVDKLNEIGWVGKSISEITMGDVLLLVVVHAILGGK